MYSRNTMHIVLIDLLLHIHKWHLRIMRLLDSCQYMLNSLHDHYFSV